MKTIRFLFFTILLSALAYQFHSRDVSAQTASNTGAPLLGQVTSTQEGAMEGVLVTVKKDRSADECSHGVPRRARAVLFPCCDARSGALFNQDSSSRDTISMSPTAVDISAGKTVTADIKLRPTKNLAAQLTYAEWLNSMPVTDAQKAPLRTLHHLSHVDSSTWIEP